MNFWKAYKPQLLLLVSLFVLLATEALMAATFLPQAVRQLDCGKINSFSGMLTAVKTLSDAQSRALGRKDFELSLQQLIVTKSGECIKTAANHHQNGLPLSLQAKKDARQLHLDIRELLGENLRFNQKTISNFQENTLDQLKDPSAFLNSPRWQGPQHLITLASYWIGWNGYYGSLVISEGDPLYRDLLSEAVKGFSRVFVDAREDDAAASSLFGRGLCYSRLDDYQKARKDFNNARLKIGKDDPLYVRCLYEDVRIMYRSGNYESAQRRLDEISEDFQEEKIPYEIATGLKNIRSKLLIEILKKQGDQDINESASSPQMNMELFARARKSVVNSAAVPSFYRYVQENASFLENRSFDQLGYVASMALGDLYFGRQDYVRALEFYRPVMADIPTYLASYQDGVWFRTAYCHSKMKHWKDAVLLLDQFHSIFKKSSLARKAADLYYTAAVYFYEQDNSGQSQHYFINATRIYIHQYRGKNKELDKARFALAKHYQEAGELQKASDLFGLITEDSPNYHAAQYHRIHHHLKILESYESDGQRNSRAAMESYKTASQGIQHYKSVIKRNKSLTPQKEIKTWFAILEAQLLMHGQDVDYQRILHLLKPLERQMALNDVMHFKPLRLRLACYHNLEMVELIESEMERLSFPDSLKKDGCIFLYRLGNHYYRQGAHWMDADAQTEANRNWLTALIIFNKLNEIFSTCPGPELYDESVRLKMAEIYMYQNQLDRSESLYLDILKKNPMSADGVYHLGNLYEKRQQWTQALDMWRRFSKGVEGGTYHWYESRYKSAVALRQLGRIQKACDILTVTLVLHPDLGNSELNDSYVDLKSEICN